MTPAFSETVFSFNEAKNDIGIIALEGAKELSNKIDRYLVNWYNAEATKINAPTKKSFLIEATCPRFTTGDGKGLIKESVRGLDLYIVADVGNYSCTYNMYGMTVPMSPDDHFADLKRIIMAAGGKCSKITVIMPILYGGRQHRRVARESLDCAWMLRELETMGVSDIITFDAHDARVQNSIPLTGFDNFFPTYQILKSLLKKFPRLKINKESFMIVSPDEGAMSRNIYYASMLGLDLGMFYKRRDFSTVINGRNPIIAHDYIGSSVMGMDIFVADDIIATGDSVINLAKELKEAGANRIFLSATFALFTEGLAKFDEAYENKYFDAVVSTNLTYTTREVESREWFIEADLSKFLALIIGSCNQKRSVSVLLDQHDKIDALLQKYNDQK